MGQKLGVASNNGKGGEGASRLSSVGSKYGGGGREIFSGPSPFDSLPEDCISKIISFTSPRDACVVACVSKPFESAANSDIVWGKFLPPDYDEPLVPPSRHFSSKKQIYQTLTPVLIDDGTKSFWLDKASGKKCIMLSASSISIIWGDTPNYWQWIELPEARFERVARLLDVCWFEISGRMSTRFLSPRTRYSVHIVFKKLDQCYGFDDVPIEAGVGFVGQEASRRYVCFDAATDEEQVQRIRRGRRRNLVKPEERQDGWMEIELGEFFNEGGLTNSDEIEMRALEGKMLNWKSGLIIQGIEIRPAKTRC